MIRRHILSTVAALTGAAMAPTMAQASLVGDSVQILEFYPAIGVIYGSAGPQTIVAGGVTYTNVGQSLVNITVDGSTATLAASSPYTPSAAAFNGFDIQDLNLGRIITGVSIDTGSGPLPLNDLSFDAHNVYVNVENVPLSGATPIIIDITSSLSGVPEPGAWTLMLIGFGGLGAVARRSRASRTAT